MQETEVTPASKALPNAQEPQALPEGQAPKAGAGKPIAHKVRRLRPIHILLIVLLAVLLISSTAGWYTTLHFLFADGRLYPIVDQTADLRGAELSFQDFQHVAEKTPQVDILWDVPFQGRRLPSSTTEISVTSLTPEDIQALDYFPNLKTVHGDGCTDYDQLLALRERRPDCSVLYSMTISGEQFDQDTETVSVSDLTAEDAEKLTALPRLSHVEVSDGSDYALLQTLQQDRPQWNLSYLVTLCGEHFPSDSTEVAVTGVTYDELARAIPALPNLKTCRLTNPAASGAELLALRADYPAVSLDWQVQIGDKTFPSDITELDISGMQVGSCEAVESVVSSLPNLEKLIMSDCGIENEDMAAFRERQRENYKVVWTVYMGKHCKLRTDAIYFMPIEQGEYYFQDKYSYDLRYCEDLICLDLGHHMIHNVDFLAFMPHLKYLILAHSGVRYIDPIVNCQELVYLEVDWSEIQDYTPIAELKNLEDLNITRTYQDVTPLLKMTWLKNLWAYNRSPQTQRQLIEALPNTNVVVAVKSGWRKLPNYYAQRDIMGKPYMID